MLQFADSLLSKDQMKKVRGGCGGGSGNCRTTCNTYGPVSYPVSSCSFADVARVCGPDNPYACSCY